MKATQVTDGLYELQGYGNCFLLETAPNELTVVDTGFPGNTRTILNEAQALGYAPDAIKHILITHADIDHVGSLGGLQAATNARVYAGTKSVPYILNRKSPEHMPFPISWLPIVLQPLLQKHATIDRELQDGDTLDIGGGIRVIAIPGHTEDNIGFYWEARRALFGADLFSTMNGTLGFSPTMINWNMEIARESARTALELAPEFILVGHGKSVNIVTEPHHKEAMLAAIGLEPAPAV